MATHFFGIHNINDIDCSTSIGKEKLLLENKGDNMFLKPRNELDDLVNELPIVYKQQTVFNLKDNKEFSR